MSRLQLLVNRAMSQQNREIYEFGIFQLDIGKGILLRENRPVTLQWKTFELLCKLVKSNGNLLTRDELMNELWANTFVEDNNLSQHIRALRKALGEGSNGTKFIETVPSRGYRFVADVRKAEAASDSNSDLNNVAVNQAVAPTEETIPVNPNAEPPITRQQTPLLNEHQDIRWRAKPITAIAILASALIFTAALAFFWSGHSNKTLEKQSIDTEKKAIAVLPFKVIGAESDFEYLGAGLSDVLITRLSNVKELVVRPTRSVLKFNEQSRDLAAIGRELQVDLVLDGTIQKSGEQLRITVQLVSVNDGKSLWSEQFDEKLTHIFAVEDAISARVANSLTAHLTGREQQLLAKRYTENLEAHLLYLQGRYFWNKRTPEALRKSKNYYQQAIEQDPTFALAYLGLAEVFALGGEYGVLPPRESAPLAKAAAVRALEIDDELHEAHATLAYVKWVYDRDFAGAEREFKRAIQLNDNYATAHQWYGEFLYTIERHDEAMIEIKRAQSLDPLSLMIKTAVGMAHHMARRYDAAMEQFQQVIEMDANFTRAHTRLGLVYIEKKRYAEAIAELRKGVESGGNTLAIAALGHAYAVSGNRPEAEKLLDELKEQEKRKYISPFGIALIYVGLGDRDEAFAWLQKSYDEHDPYLVFLIRIEPRLDSLRDDPRFANLLWRMNYSP